MSEEFKIGYYYLHTNSQIIHVEFDEVDWVGPFAYFNRPYVVTWGMVQCKQDYDIVMARFKERG
jgi:hypothetical protein